MSESDRVFDRETLLDATVNFIPLVILFIFIGLFLVANPWGDGITDLMTIYMYAIMFGMVVGLSWLTYEIMKRL